MPQIDSRVDFVAAEMYLAQAKKAYDDGDEHRSAAARKMVAVALDLDTRPGPIIHTGHLKES